MVRVKDQGKVHRPHEQWIRLGAEEHPQKVLRVAPVRFRLDRPTAAPDLLVGGNDRRRLRGHPHRLGDVCLVGGVVRLGIVKGERRERRPQRVHGGGVARKVRHQRQHLGRQAAVRGKLRAELVQRFTGRQRPEPQQVGGLLERGMAGQFVDVDAPVGQLALGTDDVADRGIGRNDILETGLSCRHTSPV